MALNTTTLPLRPALTSFSPTAFICTECRRHVSSSRRTKKALRIKPAESLQPSRTETQDHIIFNPPSSAPNVYHTPQKFLPKSDPRRHLSSLAPGRAATPPSTPGTSKPQQQAQTDLPTPLRTPYKKKYHLGEEQIAEIKRLREEDPRKWTRVRLADKFECSQFFVSLCCCAPQIKEERERELAAIKRRWGRKKTEAREDRQTRKEGWGRDV